MRDEPKRWSTAGSDAPEELRQLMLAGRQDLGASAEVLSLRERLARTLPSEAGLPQPRPATSIPPVRPRWIAWVAGGVGTAAVAWFATRTPSSEPGPPPPAAPAISPSVIPPPPLPELAAPSVVPPAPPRAEPAKAEPPRAASPNIKTPRRAPARGHVAAEAEAKLLERARAALAAQPSEALALTEEHGRRFARGALREEREVVAIQALRKLGRSSAAAERAARFEQRYPQSVHIEKIRGRQ
jgi:hypothetical protein